MKTTLIALALLTMCSCTTTPEGEVAIDLPPLTAQSFADGVLTAIEDYKSWRIENPTADFDEEYRDTLIADAVQTVWGVSATTLEDARAFWADVTPSQDARIFALLAVEAFPDWVSIRDDIAKFLTVVPIGDGLFGSR